MQKITNTLELDIEYMRTVDMLAWHVEDVFASLIECNGDTFTIKDEPLPRDFSVR